MMPINKQDDAMDTSPSKSDMGPPAAVTSNGSNSTPASPPTKEATQQKDDEAQTNTSQPTSGGAGAAAASNQPKVVQTAFIHKLYNMLEDQSIQHLISWSNSNESFLISPSSEFSKVLSSYFKHTNVSSFVRQLNMYGFHKVSDVFHTGSPDTPLWEFKHGNGSFKRGDLAGLREIKRRASRHTLIHRDSFSTAPKSVVVPQVLPAEAIPETLDQRMGMLEQTLYDMHARLARSEEAHAVASTRCQTLTDALTKALHHSHDLSGIVFHLVQDPEHQAHRAASIIQHEIAGSIAHLRNDPLLNSYQVSGVESGQVSPRQLAQDDQRRGSLREPARSGLFRPLAPSPRPNASGAGASSPSNGRHYLPQMQPGTVAHPVHQHPLSSAIPGSSYLSRRHTSADIRADGWHPGQQVSTGSHLNPSAASGAHSAQYPSSPLRALPTQPSLGPGEQRIRESLANYQMGSSSSRRGTIGYPPHHDSRPTTPPTTSQVHANGGLSGESGWASMAGARPLKDVFRNTGVDHGHSNPSSSPATRRSSLANIHTILNPADTAERDRDEDDSGVGAEEWRKRKRLM